MPHRSGDPRRPETVVFLHVPKAGGQTLRSVLGRTYGADAILDHRGRLADDVDLADLAGGEVDWERIRLVEGHLVHGVGEQVPGPVAYVTVLRDPVDRVVSLHRYIQRTPEHHLHEVVKGLSLAEFVASDLDRVEVVDGQVRQIAGRLHQDPDEDTLRTALANLDAMAAVGVVEDLDRALLLLRRRFGWRLPVYRARNVGGASRPVAEDDRQVVARANLLDRRLWEAARDRQAREVAEAGAVLRAELPLLRLGNRLAQVLRG